MRKLLVAILLVGLTTPAFSEIFLGKMWRDLKAHSEIDLGKKIAYGSLHDFVYGDTLLGLKAFLCHYRKLQFEAGATQRVDGQSPVMYTFGASVALQPFLKPITLPEDYKLLRSLYVGPFVGYDLHRWRGGLQIHLPWRFE